MKEVCGAKTKSGEACQKSPLANGKCRLHGGLTPNGVNSPQFKTGEYAKSAKRQLFRKFENVTKDLATLDEIIYAQQELIEEYHARFSEGIPKTAGDIQLLMQWSSMLVGAIERQQNIKNKTALTKAEVTFLAVRISDVISRYISDPIQQSAIVNEIFRGLVSSSSHELRDEN